MKIVRLCVLGWLTACCAMSAGNDQEAFLRGQTLYEQREFNLALDTYKTIEHKSSAVWYNMGNCWYKLEQYAQALACWRSAECDATLHELGAIAYNIHVLKAKIGAEQDSRMQALVRWARNMVAPCSLFQLQLALLLVLYLLFFFIKYCNRGKKYGIVMSVMLGIGLVLVGAVAVKYYSHMQKVGVITKQKVSVYSGPDKQYHVVGAVGLAAEITIKEQRGDWYKIRSNVVSGWIAADNLVVV